MNGATIAAAAALLGLAALGCQPRIGPFQPEASLGPSSAPIQRVIPLRFVVLTHCNGCRDCRQSCNHGPAQGNLVDSVQAANETFAAAGLRFEIASIERIEAPSFWQHGARGPQRRWHEVRAEALRVFPWAPAEAWRDPYVTKPADMWLTVLTAAFARPHEITVYVQAGNGSHAGTAFPDGGRGIWASDGTFGRGSSRGTASPDLFLFAHELGHYFGLRHTFAHAGVNPINGRPQRLADRWDLVYRPGSGPGDPHRFFHSWEEARSYSDDELWLIEDLDRDGSNCVQAGDGSLECTLPGRNGYSEEHRSGSDALKGLSIPLRPGESSMYRWARNAEDYGSMAVPRRLSASQMEMIRASLVYPMYIAPKTIGAWKPLPDGVEALPSYRTTLGLRPPY
jgi:hypothetical protein